MGEKGNVADAASTVQASVVERTTTLVTDTTGDVASAIRDQAVGAVAAGAVGAAAARVRKRDDTDRPNDGPESTEADAAGDTQV